MLVAVTVTYGDRGECLAACLESLRAEGLESVVVVDNGARFDVAAVLAGVADVALEHVRLPHNAGSAAGFAAGLQRALSLGATDIWLLDDDNLVRPGALWTLLKARRELESRLGAEVVVVANRPNHIDQQKLKQGAHKLYPPVNAFRGIHVWQRLTTALRRFWPVGAAATKTNTTLIPVPLCSYSGMLFRAELLERVGLPDERYVLYADDQDFSYRMRQACGAIYLVSDAQLLDVQRSWNTAENRGAVFASVVTQGSDTQAYYSTRNSTYFNVQRRNTRQLVWLLNVLVVLLALCAVAVAARRPKRYGVVLLAFFDGLRGRLGLNPRYGLD